MAQVDWHSIMNGNSQQKKRYQGANVRFFYAYNENREKSMLEGRPIFDEIPSISIRWPGMDETVRRIEPQDIQEYPELYAAFRAGSDVPQSGTPLAEWPPIPGSALRELQHFGFKTVEQLAEASDETKRKMGTLGKFVKTAKDWIEAANGTQNDIVKLKAQLDRETKRSEKMAEQLELLMQRVEASEGTDLRSARKEVIAESELDLSLDVDSEEPKRRGRPSKV